MTPPTAPPNLVSPAVLVSNAAAPLTVLLNQTTPVPPLKTLLLPLEAMGTVTNEVSASRVTAPSKVWLPVVRNSPPAKRTLPCVLTLVKAVRSPTARAKVVTPVSVTVKDF